MKIASYSLPSNIPHKVLPILTIFGILLKEAAEKKEAGRDEKHLIFFLLGLRNGNSCENWSDHMCSLSAFYLFLTCFGIAFAIFRRMITKVRYRIYI